MDKLCLCFLFFGGVFRFFRVREHRQKQIFAVFTHKEGIPLFSTELRWRRFAHWFWPWTVPTETYGRGGDMVDRSVALT